VTHPVVVESVALLAIVTLDGYSELTLTSVTQAVVWTASCILTWRLIWGPPPR
jgi:hypothetical protein